MPRVYLEKAIGNLMKTSMCFDLMIGIFAGCLRSGAEAKLVRMARASPKQTGSCFCCSRRCIAHRWFRATGAQPSTEIVAKYEVRAYQNPFLFMLSRAGEPEFFFLCRLTTHTSLRKRILRSHAIRSSTPQRIWTTKTNNTNLILRSLTTRIKSLIFKP
jgi:hypothetical protein